MKNSGQKRRFSNVERIDSPMSSENTETLHKIIKHMFLPAAKNKTIHFSLIQKENSLFAKKEKKE